MNKQTIGEHSENHDSDSKPLRPYQSPAILSRERLESAANVCSGYGLKTQPTIEIAPGGGVCGQTGTHS